MLTGLSVYLPESLLTVFDNLEFLIRIVLAAILGAMVGLERTKQQKDAGIRTHCIVCLLYTSLCHTLLLFLRAELDK